MLKRLRKAPNLVVEIALTVCVVVAVKWQILLTTPHFTVYAR